MTKNKRQIGIFAGLKILEIGGIFLIPYLISLFGKFLIISSCEENIINKIFTHLEFGLVCDNIGFWEGLGIGLYFMMIIFVLIIFSIGLFVILRPIFIFIYELLKSFIQQNWQWSKQINEKLSK